MVEGSPSRAGKKKAAQSRPLCPPKTMKCALCRRVYTELNGFNQHHKKVHRGAQFGCEYCPKKFKTTSNKKKHENTVCPADRSPAGVRRGGYTLPRTPPPIPKRKLWRAIQQEPCKDPEYTTTVEEPHNQENKGKKDMNRAKLPGRESLGVHNLQPLQTEAHAQEQMQKVRVMIRKIPSQRWEEGNHGSTILESIKKAHQL